MCCLLSLTLFVALYLAQEMNIIIESLMHIAVFMLLRLCTVLFIKATRYDGKKSSESVETWRDNIQILKSIYSLDAFGKILPT